MKALIITAAMLASGAYAEVIECPAQERNARLIGASMYEGEKKEHELVGMSKEKPNGFDVEFGFNRGDAKWLACWYEPIEPKWYRVSAEATGCVLRQRQTLTGKVTAVVECK